MSVEPNEKPLVFQQMCQQWQADAGAAVDASNAEPVEVETPDEPVDTRDLIRNAVSKQRDGADDSKPAPRDKPASQQSASERVRDESGRFAPAEPDKAAPKPPGGQQQNQPAAQQQPAQQAADDTPRAPGSFSPAAKIAFDTAPPELRAAIAKREAEVNQGFAKYAGVDQYVKMAEQSGTTLPKALDSYIQIEAVLRRDPVAGIERIAGNMGVHPVSLANAILAKFGHAGAPQQAPNGQQQRPAPQQPFDESALTDKIIQRFQAEQARTSTASEIEAFKSDPANRFFENVRPAMAALAQSNPGLSLKDLYDRACWADPEIRAHLSAPQAAAQRGADAVARARGAAKAVTGAPAPGTRGRAPSANETTHDTVRRALDEARGAV